MENFFDNNDMVHVAISWNITTTITALIHNVFFPNMTTDEPQDLCSQFTA